MSNILHLFQDETKDYDFIVFRKEDSQGIYCFSPEVMRLGKDFYIVDIKTARSYWENLSSAYQKDYLELIMDEIRRSVGIKNHFVLCHHPFEGLLLYDYYAKEKAPGFFFTSLTTKNRVFNSISISVWVSFCDLLSEYLEEIGQLGKNKLKYSSKINSFQRTLKHLGIKTLGELKVLKSFDIERRFGSYIGKLWLWTYPELEENEDINLFNFNKSKLNGFPWVNFFQVEKPSYHLHLDSPLSEWEQVKFMLTETFDKFLKVKEVIFPYKILEMKWEITLFDLDTCSLVINFKTPLDLKTEFQNEYTSLLIQFHFAFESLKDELNKKYEEIGSFNCALVIGWRVEVSKTICPSYESHSLFINEKIRSLEYLEIEELQNKLKNEIKKYRVLDTNIPSYNFIGEDVMTSFSDDGHALELHPFYLYESPVAIDESEFHTKKFLERTSSDWWKSKNALDTYRDYFICELKNKNIVFVYRDYNGSFFIHGIFS